MKNGISNDFFRTGKAMNESELGITIDNGSLETKKRIYHHSTEYSEQEFLTEYRNSLHMLGFEFCNACATSLKSSHRMRIGSAFLNL